MGIVSLIPALFLIIYIFKTKRILESLIFASLLGFILVDKWQFFPAFVNAIITVGTDENTLWLFIVCGLMGSLISLLERSGGTYAFGEWVLKHTQSRKKTLGNSSEKLRKPKETHRST